MAARTKKPAPPRMVALPPIPAWALSPDAGSPLRCPGIGQDEVCGRPGRVIRYELAADKRGLAVIGIKAYCECEAGHAWRWPVRWGTAK